MPHLQLYSDGPSKEPNTGIVVFNPAQGMDVCLHFSCPLVVPRSQRRWEGADSPSRKPIQISLNKRKNPEAIKPWDTLVFSATKISIDKLTDPCECKYVVGSKSFRPDIQKPRQMENAVRDI